MTENDTDTTDDVETLVLAREGGVIVRRRHAAPVDPAASDPVDAAGTPSADAKS